METEEKTGSEKEQVKMTGLGLERKSWWEKETAG